MFIHPILAIKYSSPELITIVTEEVLKGDYTNLSLLTKLFWCSHFNNFFKDSKQEAAFNNVIGALIKRCEQRLDDCPNAMTLRAILHQNGIGGQVDMQKTITLYERAIKFGNTTAMTVLADMYKSGVDGQFNHLEAIKLYEQAMELGHVDAIYKRALMYDDGEGGTVNKSEAIRLLEQAIKLGHAGAMNQRALLHEHGLGCDINIPEAIHLYDQAVALGYGSAMTNRALAHIKGLNGIINIPEAIRLYEQAFRLGTLNAEEDRQKIKIENSNMACQVLELIWSDLLTGESFTRETIALMQKYCVPEIIKKLNDSSCSTNLIFERQLKANPEHPLFEILKDHIKEVEWHRSFAAFLSNQRNTLFGATGQDTDLLISVNNYSVGF